MEQDPPQHGFPFWLQWILATAIGLGLGWEIANIVGPASQGILYLSIAGIFIGFAQWLVVRKRVSQSGWWILATFSGWALFDILGWIMPPPMPGPIFLALGGLTIGFSQWVLLRRHYSRAYLWIIVSAFAWILGMIMAFCGMVVGLTLGEISGGSLQGISSITMASLFGIPFGAITAYGLARVLAHPLSDMK